MLIGRRMKKDCVEVREAESLIEISDCFRDLLPAYRG
jgi:hypothetical protein